MSNTLIARIFVTSYAIGNNDGFGVGKWFDLEDYSEKSAFIEAATDYVKNDLGDKDPELCFSDWELDFKTSVKCGGLIGESGVKESVWELFDMTDRDIEILQAYLINADVINDSLEDTLEKAIECHAGEFDSLEDYANHYLEGTQELVGLSDTILNSIDFTDMGRRLTNDMNVHENHYFYND